MGSGYEWIYKQLMQLYSLFSWRQATNVVVLTMETHDHIFLHLEQYGLPDSEFSVVYRYQTHCYLTRENWRNQDDSKQESEQHDYMPHQ